MTRKGFNLQLHQRVLTSILLDIFKKLDGKIAFKGGTCAYLFYNLPRASLDLDFDVLTPLATQEIDNLKIILRKHGAIKEFRDKQFTLFFLLDYQKYAPNVKLEFNKRVWKNNQYNSVWFLGVEMKIADQATVLTNKMVALTNRRQPVPRDLFDIYYFLKLGFPANEKLIKERTQKNIAEYRDFLISFIKKYYTPKNVLHGLGEVLEKKQKEWVKKELISQTIKELEKLT